MKQQHSAELARGYCWRVQAQLGQTMKHQQEPHGDGGVRSEEEAAPLAGSGESGETAQLEDADRLHVAMVSSCEDQAEIFKEAIFLPIDLQASIEKTGTHGTREAERTERQEESIFESRVVGPADSGVAGLPH